MDLPGKTISNLTGSRVWLDTANAAFFDAAQKRVQKGQPFKTMLIPAIQLKEGKPHPFLVKCGVMMRDHLQAIEKHVPKKAEYILSVYHSGNFSHTPLAIPCSMPKEENDALFAAAAKLLAQYRIQDKSDTAFTAVEL